MRTSQICPTCTTYINSLCVVYNGVYLSNINVSPLDALDTILANINTATGVINSSVASLNTSIIATNSNVSALTANLALKENSSNKSSGAIGTSVTLFPTQSAVKTYVDGEVLIINGSLLLKENIADKITTQATFISNGTSVVKYPAVKAVKDYIDSVTVGLLQDNGQYDPTITSDYPTSANTLSGGPIQVGDLWYISVNGTINGNAVLVGYSVRALINAAGPTTDADWAIANVGIGFVPENSANKSTDGTFNSGVPSSVLFPTQSAVATYIAANAPTLDQVLTVGAVSTTNLVIGSTLVTPLEYSEVGAGYIDIYSTNSNGYTQYTPTGITIDEIVGGNQMIINYNNNNQTIDFPADSGTLALQKYTVYTALLTQVGTADPTAIVLENTTGQTITWVYGGGLGYYIGNYSSTFDPQKTVVLIGSGSMSLNQNISLMAGVGYSNNLIEIFAATLNNPSQNNVLKNTTIEIRIYP